MSKIRIEKLKQGLASNNDVLVFRNDLGTFQGQSNLSVNTITLGTNTVNSSVYTGSATYLNGQLASFYATNTGLTNGLQTAYANAALFANTIANTAFTNAVSVAATDATTKAATAYSNATTYADTKAAAAYSNAIAYSGNAAAAYANAIAYSGNAALAYANATSYADTRAATAYSNAVAYAASNTYVNSTFAPLASPTFSGVVTVSGNLVVTGNTISINTTSINVTDSLLYLATNNEVSDILDIGFGAHYNNGSGANGHTGLVRSATTKKWYLFQNYQPELYANNTIDFANTGTGVQMADLVVGNLVANSTLTVTGAANLYSTLAAGNTTITGFANVSSTLRVVGATTLSSTLSAGNTTVTGFINVSTTVAAANINTTGTVLADIIAVTNVEQTQTNLQVDPAGSAFLNAIIYG